MSIRNIINICKKYSVSKIKSVYANTLIRSFRRRYKVNQNLQFLIFRQMIPEDGFKTDDDFKRKGRGGFKSFKTKDLEKARKEEVLLLDDYKDRMIEN